MEETVETVGSDDTSDCSAVGDIVFGGVTYVRLDGRWHVEHEQVGHWPVRPQDAAFLDEVVRLRADNRRLADKAEGLQGLIDAWAKLHCSAGDLREYAVARDALLDAASTEQRHADD